MKRFKRMIALMCAMVMMLAMSTVAFADEATRASITVKGLAQDDVETVKIYKIATATHFGEWKFETWAEKYKSLASSAKEYTFDWNGMYTAVTADGSDITATDTKTCDAGSSTVTFTGLDSAAYLVTATGSKTTYAVMGAKTYEYNDETGRYTLIPTTVYAKTSDVPTKKEADDQFVHNGQKVTFTITTVLPAATTLDENNQEVQNEFKVYDKPENLKDLKLVSVKIGDADVTDGITLADSTSDTINGETDVYTIDLTTLLSRYEGKTVVLTLTATVAGDQGYTNSAWNNKTKFDTDTGKPENPGKVDGYTAEITITKYDDTLTYNGDGNVIAGKTLTGAKFQIKKVDADGNENDALKFTQTATGQYIYDENGTVTDVEVDESGAVNVSGLDEGIYNIFEIEAPEGYTVISGVAGTVTVEVNDPHNVSLYSNIADTKLSSLPFTGGMGTTLFTVFGVIIMAAAAGLFFANKKKSAK